MIYHLSTTLLYLFFTPEGVTLVVCSSYCIYLFHHSGSTIS